MRASMRLSFSAIVPGRVPGTIFTQVIATGRTTAPTSRRRQRRPPTVARGALVLAGAAVRYTACAGGVAHAVWVAHADRVHVRVPHGLARSRRRLAELAELVVRTDADRIAGAMALAARQQ